MNENESKKVPEVILAPLTGKAVPLSEVPDPVFSDKVLGDGVAIIPADVRSSNVICNGKNAERPYDPPRYEHKSGMIIPRYANIG